MLSFMNLVVPTSLKIRNQSMTSLRPNTTATFRAVTPYIYIVLALRILMSQQSWLVTLCGGRLAGALFITIRTQFSKTTQHLIPLVPDMWLRLVTRQELGRTISQYTQKG